MVTDLTSLGSVSEGCQIAVLVPDARTSTDAVVETRLRKDNLTVWFDEQKILVEDR